jgi:hypothetical protein
MDAYAPQGPGHAIQPSKLDRLDVACLLYVLVPSLIFIVGWLELRYAMILLVTMLAGLFFARESLGFAAPSALSKRVVLCCGLIAICWSLLGGAGHFFYANAFDWRIRDAVLRDLVVADWPVFYRGDSGATLLRAPLGYFLVAAGLGKLTSLRLADFWLFVWTWLGVWLTLMQVAACMKKPVAALIAVLVFMLFSGLDIAGLLLTSSAKLGDLFSVQHLEWWGQYFQYSSNATLLFWVPNHALPGWLLGLLLYRHFDKPVLLPWLGLMFFSSALWSPLVSIGLVGLQLAYMARQVSERWWRDGRIWFAWLAWVPGFLVLGTYLTYRSSSIASGWGWRMIPDPLRFWENYLLFVVLEFGLFAIALYRLRPRRLLLVLVAILLMLPLYSFGPNSDLAMRGSIPALAMLAMLSSAELIRFGRGWRWPRISWIAPLLLFLLIGAVTPLHEMARSLLTPRWRPDLVTNVFDASHGDASNYLAPVTDVKQVPFLKKR